ncbi:MAG: hypothetical protein Q3M24_00695 [Candidatus Electrothrix aestuarii]|uniref:MotA/TolQ/ExbB proton channel domain-containing protein n=1 Tax=Candidatus Electrothrix aestuarii TaxID=3062594 RepID=A0AAU8LWR5_9BACT|nr:hypothetical protein [Candidatus Electrothrix aestuarii]
MKKRFFYIHFFCIITLWITGITAPAFAETEGVAVNSSASPADWFIYAVILLGLLSSILSMLLIRSALARSKWSIADALSEEAELTERGEDGKLLLTSDNQPILIRKLAPSSSRMVALMGTIAILFLFLSFGAFALFHFAKTGKMPEGINNVVKFLTAGLTLFAPYVVNKFSKSFEALSPKH